MVITRQVVEASQRLETFVEQQLDTLARTLQGYQLIQRTPLFLDERVAELVEFTWLAQNGAVYQRQATVICPISATFPPQSRVALTITATTLEILQIKQASIMRELQTCSEWPISRL